MNDHLLNHVYCARLLGTLLAFSTLSWEGSAQQETVAEPGTATVEPVQIVGPPGDGVYAITEAGQHHRRWERLSTVTREDGTLLTQTNSFVEIASGLNRLDAETGRFVPAEARFELINGAAVSRHTGHSVIITGLTGDFPVDVLTPLGERLAFRVLGISYFSAESGQSIMLAEPKAVQGQLVEPDQVVFERAFDSDGLEADLVYKISLAGISQEVVLRTQPPSVVDSGFGEKESVRLQVITELLTAPDPVITERVIRAETDPGKRQRMHEPDLVDQTLRFGQMQMVRGTAFALGGPEVRAEPLVTKRFEVIGERKVLFEELALEDAVDALSALPIKPQAGTGKERFRKLSREALVASLKRPDLGSGKMMALAQPETASRLRDKGWVIDWDLIQGGQNMTFFGGQTYYLTGLASYWGTVTAEGGTVIKAVPYTNASYKIYLSGSFQSKATSFQPVSLTARDDDSVGEVLPDSQHTPSGNYANWLSLQTPGQTVLSNLRFCHSVLAMSLWSATNYTVSDVQIVKCANGIELAYGAAAVRNVLIDSATGHAMRACYGSTVRAEHLTIHNTGVLNYIYGTPANQYFLTNCLVTQATTTNAYSGVNNVFLGSSSGIYASAGGGNFYLAAGSPYRSAGSTSIDAQLRSSLTEKTVSPPIYLTNAISSSVVLSPQAARGGGVPSIGYHYPALDFLISALDLSNVTVTLTNGVAVGYYGGYGFKLYDGTKLISEGMPKALNRLVRYRTVQESALASSEPFSHVVLCTGSYSPAPEVRLRFTEMSLLPSHNASTLLSVPYSGAMGVSIADCQLRGGTILGYGTGALTLAVTNNLFERVSGNFGGSTAVFFNNTFYGGTASFPDFAGQNFTVKDNWFDRTAVSNGSVGNWALGNNGYVSGSSRLSPTSASDVILAAPPSYQSGALGSYYLPSAIALVNAGSRLADAAGLYYHTTQAKAWSKEGCSPVDIGFHYFSANPEGQVPDTDGDGVVDCYENLSGNNKAELVLYKDQSPRPSINPATQDAVVIRDEDDDSFDAAIRDNPVATQITIHPGIYNTKGVWNGELPPHIGPGFRLRGGVTLGGPATVGQQGAPNGATLQLTGCRQNGAGYLENVVVACQADVDNSGITIRDLLLDCDGDSFKKIGSARAATLTGVALWGSDNKVINVTVKNARHCEVAGQPEAFIIVLNAQSQQTSVGNLVQNCEIANFVFESAIGGCSGITLNGPNAPNYIQGVVEDCRVYLNGFDPVESTYSRARGGEYAYNGHRTSSCVFRNNQAYGAQRGFNNDSDFNESIVLQNNHLFMGTGTSYGVYLGYGTSFSRLFDNEITIYSGENSSAFVLGDNSTPVNPKPVNHLMFDHNHVFLRQAPGNDKAHGYNCAADLDGDGLVDPPEKIHLEFNDVDNSPLLVDNVWPGNPEALGYQYGNSPAGIFGTQPNRSWQFSPARADFGQDGSIDAIIQNTNATQMTITLRYFDSQDNRLTDPGSSVNYLLLGSGDMNRDGRTDLLFEGSDPNYQWLAVWYMKSSNMVESVFLSPDHITQTWKIATVADFNSDSKLDILFQDYLGHAILWHMDGRTQIDAVELFPQPDFYDRIVGTGDFDHDGKTDILFQLEKPNLAGDGDLIVWYMDGRLKKQNLEN